MEDPRGQEDPRGLEGKALEQRVPFRRPPNFRLFRLYALPREPRCELELAPPLKSSTV